MNTDAVAGAVEAMSEVVDYLTDWNSKADE
jgi:hypothetical protein